jgi:hypothetical protein
MFRTNYISGRSPEFILRIIVLVFLFTVAFIFGFILLGYYGASKTISYLPGIDAYELTNRPKGINRIELKSSGNLLTVDEIGNISVLSPDGGVIMSNLVYYASYEGTTDKLGLDDVSAKLSSDSTISISGRGSSGTLVRMSLTFPERGNRLDVDIKTTYTSSSLVHRESLVAGFAVPVSEIYTKNGQIAVDSLDSEYWLQKQGVRFGRENKSALIYHTPGVSSLQLDVKRNLLFVNLEYSMDHPHIYIPYQEDGGGKWEDQSMANYSGGQERSNFFSVYFNNLPKVIPRLMLVPHGYLSGYVFTEHADGGNIGSHRAAYFGSDTIKRIEKAVGGFVGNRIPVTKSTFYTDNEGSNHFSIRNDPDYPQYLDFLDQLNGSGMYEICLHTPENSTSDRELLEESVRFMKERFDAVTWIDHGMYSGKLNRETFVGDGLNPNSDLYAADIWEKYGTKYFWNSAVELIREKSWQTSPKKKLSELKFRSASVDFWRQFMPSYEIRKLGFFRSFAELVKRYAYHEELNTLKPFKGSSYPTPVYWQHPTRTKSFYSWATDYSYENMSKRLWANEAENQYTRELRYLDKLITDRGIYISHGYYIRNLPEEDVTKDLNGKISINPYFEKILEYMAKKRDGGDLYITTIRDLLNYWIMTENISFKYLRDGDISIYNYNNKPVNGLSLAVKSKGILVDGETPKQRRVGDETIFWFDIQPNDHVVISIVQENN